jgi:predicted enzyme related to lactoylglutathione lyase
MPPKIGWPIWIGVVAEDLDAQAAFYRDVLGFRQTGSGPDWVHFEVDGWMFEVLARSSLPQYDARRVQVGFEVEDIAVARDALIEMGVAPISGIEGGGAPGGRWAYFRDPEGNVFEVKERDRPDG